MTDEELIATLRDTNAFHHSRTANEAMAVAADRLAELTNPSVSRDAPGTASDLTAAHSQAGPADGDVRALVKAASAIVDLYLIGERPDVSAWPREAVAAGSRIQKAWVALRNAVRPFNGVAPIEPSATPPDEVRRLRDEAVITALYGALAMLLKNHGSYINELPGESGVTDLKRARDAIAKANAPQGER